MFTKNEHAKLVNNTNLSICQLTNYLIAKSPNYFLEYSSR